MNDPWEAYFRHERRRQRKQVTIVVGSVVTLIVLIGAVIMFHQEVLDERAASPNSHLVSLR